MITFDGDDDVSSVVESGEASNMNGVNEVALEAPAVSKPIAQRTESDYEMIGDDVGGKDLDAAVDDSPPDDAGYELDELEAEIARELED